MPVGFAPSAVSLLQHPYEPSSRRPGRISPVRRRQDSHHSRPSAAPPRAAQSSSGSDLACSTPVGFAPQQLDCFNFRESSRFRLGLTWPARYPQGSQSSSFTVVVSVRGPVYVRVRPRPARLVSSQRPGGCGFQAPPSDRPGPTLARSTAGPGGGDPVPHSHHRNLGQLGAAAGAIRTASPTLPALSDRSPGGAEGSQEAAVSVSPLANTP